MQEQQVPPAEDPYECGRIWDEFFDKLDARGEARGRTHGRREVLLRQLDRRGLVLDAETRDRVLRCEDIDRLDTWIDRVFTATSAAEVFAP